MKLNYRDKVVLGILLAIIILVAGFFALIKPKMKEIKENKATLEAREKDKAEIEKKIAEIKPLQTDITNMYNETNEIVDVFIDDEKIENARKVDQYMQHFAEENKVKVKVLNATGISVNPLNYYYFTKSFPGDGILAKADLNGERLAEHLKQQEEALVLSARTSENVLQAQYSIQVEGEKEDIWNYLSALEKQKETMIINSVNLSNIEIKEKKDQPEMTEEEKAQKKPAAQIVITLYSLYELSEPDLN